MQNSFIASIALSGGMIFIATASADRGASPSLAAPPVTTVGQPARGAAPQEPAAAPPSVVGRSAGGGDCTVDAWFDPTPREFAAGCGQVPILPLSPADVNGDGVQETYSTSYACISGNCDPGQGAPQGAAWDDVVVRSALVVTPAGPKPVRTSLLSLPPSFADSFIAQLPNGGVPVPCSAAQEGARYSLNAIATGWADCDADGDLDLLAWVYAFEERLRWMDPSMGCMPEPPAPYSQRLVWFENTGYEAGAPAVPGDLNGDGTVDGQDLAILLGNWGP